MRILDRNVTERLLDRGSPEFQNFSRQLLHEVKPWRGVCRGSEPGARASGLPLSSLWGGGTSARHHGWGGASPDLWRCLKRPLLRDTDT